MRTKRIKNVSRKRVAALSLERLLEQPDSPIDVAVCLEAECELPVDESPTSSVECYLCENSKLGLHHNNVPSLNEIPEQGTGTSGWVYLVRVNEVFYKIGVATNIQRRIGELQMGCPFEVVLVHMIASSHARPLESGLHKIFAHKRVRGEWFRLDNTDVAWICALGAVI
ncbi:MAG: hypothetical protein DMF64_20210 [Acidobacteria bacterium]|nr:MAG: hypothetical protein DMF64_20210 [Acidobacteriota bacterium]